VKKINKSNLTISKWLIFFHKTGTGSLELSWNKASNEACCCLWHMFQYKDLFACLNDHF